MRILNAHFVTAVNSLKAREQIKLPEICFVGRSNVGKSSLINSLAGRKIARTSSTPGATRLINLYRVESDTSEGRQSILFSDFPGYGYSKVSKVTSGNWQEMVERYVISNKMIRRLLWVFDVRRDMDELDGMLLDWMRANGISFSLVLTKADKENRSAVVRRRRLFQTRVGPDVLPFSAKDGHGREDLLLHIGEAVSPSLTS